MGSSRTVLDLEDNSRTKISGFGLGVGPVPEYTVSPPKKTSTFLFFELLCQKLTDFHDFWLHLTSEVNKPVRCSCQIFSGFKIPKNKKVDFWGGHGALGLYANVKQLM